MSVRVSCSRLLLWLLLVSVGSGCRPVAPRMPSATATATGVHAHTPRPQAHSSATLAPPPTTGSGRVFYVAPQGDDANPGTREAPWQHPGRVVGRLQPGDTLVLLPGVYPLADYENDILRPPSGREDAWVTIRGEAGAPYPVLAGQDNLLAAVELGGAQYVRLEHLEITHNPNAADPRFRDGILIAGQPAAHLIFRDLYIHHLDEFGLDVQDVTDLHITASRITYTGFGALGGPRGEYGGWQQVWIQDTLLAYSGHYYQGGDGSNRPYDRPDGLGSEPSAGPVIIERVRAEHNFGDGLDVKADQVIIRDSIVANNTCDGVKLWGREGTLENVLIYGRGDGDTTVTPWAALVIDTTTPQARFTLTHVTIDDALGQNYLLYVQYDHPEIPVQMVWRNLILSARGPNAPVYIGPRVQLDAQGVLFAFPQTPTVLIRGDETYGCQTLSTFGPALFCAEPGFVQPAWGEPGDYHLRDDSPARDAGVPTSVTHDLDGHPRDAHPDLGAYEASPPSGDKP